nr:hypothetical protein [Tanacetum cinerariifolium]
LQNVSNSLGNEFFMNKNENNVSRNGNSRFENKSSKSGITSNKSRTVTKSNRAYIRPTYDTDPLEQGHNDDHNVFAMEKEHHVQPESINNTHLVEQGDSNTTPDSSYMKPPYLKKAQSVKPCLYDIACYKDNLEKMVIPNFDETIQLAWIRSDWMNRTSHNEIKVAIGQLYVPMVGYASENMVNFETTLKEEMVEDLEYFNSLEKEVGSLKSQPKSQKYEFSKTTDRLLEEHLSKDIMCVILRSFDNITEQTEMHCFYLEKCQKCENLELELSKSKHNKQKNVLQI